MTPSLRILAVVLAVLLVALQYKVWFSDVGYVAAQALEVEVEAQRSRVGLMARRNEILTSEVLALRQGEAAAEARARTDLGMVKQGETFYLVPDAP
ncbi:MAG: cell division protein FtsB [Gammaproteobacteria bacterium]|nr:cell division protein FtsB [Gammaproteobacteria bacterium]|tara:strand:- start:2055 stop:2342 length:288 start_codon:yes stop_codon:yes gene_type:complete